MSGQSTYQPQSPLIKWLERRLPIVGLIHSSFVAYPTPRNLNYWWTFGGILSFMLALQIVTGIVLAMHYTPHVDYAFNSVEHIMRDVNFGWLLRYLHANGASMFFLAGVVVLHIWALHVVGQNNPTGIEPRSDGDTVAFTPYATIKDGFMLSV